MLDYAALSALTAVVREGSFERAARALHVTPSAVSQRIKALEARMGGALVVRAQPCVPTDLGRRLCQHADRVRWLEHELEGSLPQLAAAEARRVVLPIAVNADSLATWLAPALADYAREAPVLLDVAVDDQDHTAEWLRSGRVLAAVSAEAQAPTGCNSLALGSLRYVAAASPDFVARHFAGGVGAASLGRAPSLVFNAKDTLQERWARRLCHRRVPLVHHTLPSPQAFVAAGVGGMGWGLHPLPLVAELLRTGRLVALVPDTPLDLPLFWHQARAAEASLQGLTAVLTRAARAALGAKR